jgi:hypothetical protein
VVPGRGRRGEGRDPALPDRRAHRCAAPLGRLEHRHAKAPPGPVRLGRTLGAAPGRGHRSGSRPRISAPPGLRGALPRRIPQHRPVPRGRRPSGARPCGPRCSRS